MDENAVVPATFQQPLQPPPDLVLAADNPLAEALIELRAGQRVRAAPGHRATLLVPEAGLVVDKENVRFENIDFVWKHASLAERAGRAGNRAAAGRPRRVPRLFVPVQDGRGRRWAEENL